MKKTAASKTVDGDPRPEYSLDYGQSRPNRFATGGERVMVVLDADVAEVFRTSEEVNAALRTPSRASSKSSAESVDG